MNRRLTSLDHTRQPPTLRQEQPVLAAVALWGVVGCLVSLLLAVVDAIWARAQSGGPLLGTMALAATLYPVLGLVVGLLSGAVAGGLDAATGGEGTLWSRLRRSAELDTALGGALLAGAVCLAVQVGLLQLFAGRVAHSMANPRLASLSTGLAAAASSVLCVLLFFPLWRFARVGPMRLVPRLRTRTLTVVLGLGLVLLLAGVVVLRSLDWRAIGFSPWLVLAGLVLGTNLVARRLRERAPGWQRGRALVLALLLAGGLGAAAPLAARGDAARAAAEDGGLLLPLLVGQVRGMGDADHDGYARSGWFGGADCDDANPSVHPGARDVPGNGVDENCHGGDAVPRAPKTALPKPAVAKRPAFDGNLLLVCIDTLRADKLGVMGHEGGLTPNLDRLAQGGVLFAQTYAQGPNTPQSFPAIFTSQYSSRAPFYKRFTGYPRLKPEAVTLFEVLQRHGVQTAAVTSHFYFKPSRGITQGVAHWDNRGATNIKDSNKDISAPRIVPRAVAKLKELAQSGKRFSLFVHLSEPHSTYVTHPGMRITKRGVAGLQQKYDFEIKFVDQWLGKLLQGLVDSGAGDRTAVVLFSDHGEAFGEHRFYFHGQALYNEVLHVPMVFRLPGRWAHRRVVRQRVGLIDLAPTILDLMGLDSPPSFQGQSLAALVAGPEGATLPARRLGAVLMPYPAWPKGQQAMFSGRYKVIRRTTSNRFELYDVEADPREQNNLWTKQPALARKLKEELLQFVEQEL